MTAATIGSAPHNRLEAKSKAVREAVERADTGHIVEGTEVHAWLESWDGEAELPKPSVTRASAAV